MTVEEQGKGCWEWGGMTVPETCGRSGAGVMLRALQTLPQQQCYHHLWLPGLLHSHKQPLCFGALDFTRANIRGMRISTLHQHILREIRPYALKCRYSHQKRPTWIQLRNINSSTALIHLQSGRSAKYLKKCLANKFAQMHFESTVIGLAIFLSRKGGSN